MLPPSSFIKKYAPVLKPFLEYDPMSEKEALIARQYVFTSVNLEFISILTTTLLHTLSLSHVMCL